MEGDMAHSAEKKKIKKANLSKSVAGKSATRKSILNRMSSGKKHPRSEPRIRNGLQTSPNGDLLAKRLLFRGSGADDEAEATEELGQSPVKSKKGKTKVSKLGTPAAKISAEKPPRSASKWQISETKSSAKEPGEDGLAKRKVRKMTSGKKSRDKMVDSEEFIDDDDGEIDFPILKRKSLGLEEQQTSKLMVVGKKVLQEAPQDGQKARGLKERVTQGQVKGGQMEQGTVETGEEGKKRRKKNRKRGRKRKRSNSESEEPQAKKGKQVMEDFAVRCGNLPRGANQTALKMFFGEADIFPKTIHIKCKKKSNPGEKKHFVKYATIICNTADEAERLFRLNGITMPSPSGSRDCRLLIHHMNKSGSDDMTLAFRRKLFIKKLHPRTTEDELVEYFEERKYNPTNAIISRKGDSKKSRGYAFVWLESAGDVNRALSLKNPTLRDQVFSIARSHRSPHTAQEP